MKAANRQGNTQREQCWEFGLLHCFLYFEILYLCAADEPPRIILSTLCQVNPRLDLREHSMTGFEWGFAGSGPAQLALAILADTIGDEPALHVYRP